MSRLSFASYKKTYLYMVMLIGLFSCSPSANSNQEETSVEATEEAAEATEVPVEYQDVDQLQNLVCKEDGNIILSNFYQLTESDVSRIDQEPRYYGMLLKNISSIYRRIRNCLGEEANSPDQIDHFFDLGLGEYRNELRTDLMPLVEEEMAIVGVPFVTFATENMIPDPVDKQFNGLTYEDI